MGIKRKKRIRKKKIKRNVNTWAGKVNFAKKKSIVPAKVEQPILPRSTKKQSKVIKEIPLGYATCTSCICVRSGYSKNSNFITNVEKDYCVLVVKTKGNRAKIYFDEIFGWCTIYLEKQQRFLLNH